jgi:DNA polymerase III delta prime subunit
MDYLQKYKPTKFRDFYYIKNINSRNIYKNTIIYGSPGLGKSSFGGVLLNTTYKKEHIKHMSLFINASEQKDAKDIRERITTFTKKAMINNYKHKIIILDEADNLTSDAQKILQDLIEENNNTIFYFICNYVNNIIENIKLRCNIIEFKASKKYTNSILNKILKNETRNSKQENEKIIENIHTICNNDNDIRKAVHYLNFLLVNNIENLDIFGICNWDKIERYLLDKNIQLLSGYSLNMLNTCILKNLLSKDIIIDKKRKFICLLLDIDRKKTFVKTEILLAKLVYEYNNLFV